MRLLLAGLAAAIVLLAGCTGSSTPKPEDAAPGLELKEGLGGIRGVVVDEAIRPVANAVVRIPEREEVRTAEDGIFTFVDLEPGLYVVQAEKPGHEDAQLPATVEAGVADPDVLRLVLPRIPGKEPYAVTYKLDGKYECGFGAPVITDTCDMGVRTAYDAVNETATPPFPRNVQDNVNTMFLDVGEGAETIIQEAFWDDPAVPEMMVELGTTPIDNACDCSETYFIEVTGPSPTYGRTDRADGAFPANGTTVAARGFLPFGDPSVATNLRFTVLTTVFYNYEAPEGWTYETRDRFPL